MPRKTIRTDTKSVREEVQRSGGRPSHIDKPSRATGRRARRIAAKQQGKTSELNRADSKDRKKSVRKVDQGTPQRQKKTRKVPSL